MGGDTVSDGMMYRSRRRHAAPVQRGSEHQSTSSWQHIFHQMKWKLEKKRKRRAKTEPPSQNRVRDFSNPDSDPGTGSDRI